ncbi:MAG TPA: Gfo/Idh/MocA family oxidoreductase [Candidatus Hydrogenedentes bacterium]|nr:Gfo/Idh/MocA family oxidoreductase [Candidatus Hydrogenedentota bacterium]HOL76709.1 Gfo/Idh/MocA family oxidoreductase [Candidatus Hydrogenedentota bacterium]HPO85330.1 Gfo/Idh/MocA family oxidoreductase [Candidatus Hydrogenedentota bacterium]
MKRYSRRDFIKITSGAAASAGITAGCATRQKATYAAIAGKAPTGKATPSETVVLGIIGCAGRGKALMSWFKTCPDVRFAAVCDVYKPHREEAVELLDGKADAYEDFRSVLDRKDIDAVIVATPPHWHPLMTILACEAGKDVYCEKPMCSTPIEGRAMIKAARANNRVTQVGTQIHANENYHRVVELVRSGMLGKISTVRTVLNLNEAPNGIGFEPDVDPPADLNWDLWLGPLQPLPFNWARFKNGQHRYFAEIVGSWLSEMGPHILDLPVWALDMKAPKSASAVGGKFVINDMSTIPDTLEAVFEYDGFIMTWSNMCGNSHGLAVNRGKGITRRLSIGFHGVNGTLLADYDWHEIISEGDRLAQIPDVPKTLPRSEGHGREFLDCVKSRQRCSCDVEYHYNVHLPINLGGLSYKLGRKIYWDDAACEVIGDKEANEMLQPHYRRPWTLPV